MKSVVRVPIGLFAMLLLVLYLATSMGCSRGPEFAEPPVPESYEDLDPIIVDLIQKVVERIDSSEGDPEPILRLCTIYQANDLPALATQCYQLVVDVDADIAQAWYQLARVKAGAGDREGAIADMTRSIEIFPHYPPSHTRKAQWLLEGGDVAGAKLVFEDALQIDPQNYNGRIGLARVYIQQEKSQAAVDLLSAVLADNPDEGYAYMLLGNALKKLGRMDEAAAALASGTASKAEVRDDPWAAEVKKYQMSYDARLQLAYRYQTEGQLGEAIKNFERLYQEKPDDIWVLSGLGQCYLESNRAEDALKLLLVAHDLDPDSEKTHLELSAAYYELKRTEEALHHLDRALELNPESGQAHARRGQLLLSKKRYEEAIGSFETALRFSEGSMRSQVYRALGDCHSRLGSWEAAVKNYNEAVALNNNDPRLLGMLGLAAFEVGDYDLAEEALQRALQMGTENQQAMENLLAQVRSMRDL